MAYDSDGRLSQMGRLGVFTKDQKDVSVSIDADVFGDLHVSLAIHSPMGQGPFELEISGPEKT